MIISEKTKIIDLINEYPFLLDFLPKLSPRFVLLKNPALRKTMSNVATIEKAAGIGGLEPDEMIKKIVGKIKDETGKDVEFNLPGND